MTSLRTHHDDLNDDPTQARPSGDDQLSKRSDKPSDQASDKASDTPSDHDHSAGGRPDEDRLPDGYPPNVCPVDDSPPDDPPQGELSTGGLTCDEVSRDEAACDPPSYKMDEEAEGLDHARAIRELNDAFRQSFAGGAVLMTAGIINLGRTAQFAILEKVRAFTQFDTGNDPYHEHDFGAFTHDGEQIFFKIDYYDADLCHGSPDPSDPSITRRVLTIMLASDY
jgi:hypothetical protein